MSSDHGILPTCRPYFPELESLQWKTRAVLVVSLDGGSEGVLCWVCFVILVFNVFAFFVLFAFFVVRAVVVLSGFVRLFCFLCFLHLFAFSPSCVLCFLVLIAVFLCGCSVFFFI